MGFKGRKALDGAGEIFFGNAGGKFLVVAEDNEIGFDCSHRSEEVLSVTQANIRLRIGCMQRSETFLFILPWKVAFNLLHMRVTGDDDMQIASFLSFFQEEVVAWMEMVEGAEDEDGHIGEMNDC